MTLAHARATAVAVLTWCASLMWLWPRAARADALSAELRVYDWTSLAYAGGLGLLGGFLALIVALATDRRAVLEVAAEAGRNMLISPIAGATAYLCLKAAAAVGWPAFLSALTTEPRFLVIVGAGWAGIAFFQWLRGLASQAAVAVASKLVNRSNP